MRFLSFTFIVCIVFLGVVSCSKKEMKQPAPDSRRYAEAQSVLEAIRNAYVAKDLQSIRLKTTDDGFRALTTAMKPFDSAYLEFNPVFAEIQGNTIRVNVSWNGRWTYAGRTSEERGMAVFLLRGQPFQLENILRGNPFVYP